MSIEVITDKKEWSNFLDDIDQYDFYHTYDYHFLSKSENETPALLKYTQNDILIGLPILVRNIYNTNYKDITSVYGYSGPISKGITNSFDNSKYQKELLNFLKQNKFVSAFSRLNPFIANQSKILLNIGSITKQGQIVNIDLTKSLEDQRQAYQRRLKTYINKSRRCCTIKKASTKEDLKKFIEIYYENMNRVNAKDFYYFNEAYFENLINTTDFKNEILLAIDNETQTTIAGCLFIISNNIVQYHLSGTKTKFLQSTPTKLLIDEMRNIATNKGYKYFNLGGGLGGRDDDSLFNFKSAFSKDFKDFNLWKLIINHDVYDEFVSKNNIIEKSDYFPLYRSINDLNIKL